MAAAAKPWPIHKEVVNLVTKEFFAQGDRERLELNKEPNVILFIIFFKFSLNIIGLFLN